MRRGSAAAESEAFPPVSLEFVRMTQSQFEVLEAALAVDRAALYFRREDPNTGTLEFIPVAVYPQTVRVWVSSEGETDREPEVELTKELPVLFPSVGASSLLPTYPFIDLQSDTEGGAELEDGGLATPLRYGQTLIGSLVVWREEEEWSARDRSTLEKVSDALALAAVIDQQQRFSTALQGEQLRRVLSETLHQVKSPITALRTFGKLLLRRIPAQDTIARELTRDMIIQADRLVDLLVPVDEVTRTLGELEGTPQWKQSWQLQPSDGAPGLVDTAPLADALAGGEDALAAERAEKPQGLAASLPMAMLWVQDTVAPVLHAASVLGAREGVKVRSVVDDDLPAITGNVRALREALSNVLDNAIKYTAASAGDGAEKQRRAADAMNELLNATEDAENVVDVTPNAAEGAGLVETRVRCERDGGGEVVGILLEVRDNGAGIPPEELQNVMGRGVRGEEWHGQDVPGSGLGLGIARDFVQAMGGTLAIDSEGRGRGTLVTIFLPRAKPGAEE